MLSLMLTIRKNSKFFSKFLIGYLSKTKNFSNVELLILASEGDTWNKDLFDYYHLNVIYENLRCGKGGRHLFYNELAKHAKGDWLWHFCDDHYLIMDGYDEYILDYIKQNNIDSNQIHSIVPVVSNSGSISQILSRGWYETVGRMGGQGNIDSYLNTVAERMLCPERIHYPPHAIMTDFTVDSTIMTPEHSYVELDPSYKFYPFNSPETDAEINKDASLLYHAIKEGGK